MKFVVFAILMTLSMLTAAAQTGEFGNHCTTSLAAGLMVPSDCSNSSQFEGKTYCFGTEASKAAFDASSDKQAIIEKAAAFYVKSVANERVKMTQDEAIAQVKSNSCDLSNKDVGYLEFDGMDLRHCKMENTSFFGAYLRGANLAGANLQRAYLNLARLENANFAGADLSDAIIFQAIFDKTNFKGANLTNARVIGTLGAVDMSGANARNARFGLDIGNQPMGQMKFDSVGGKFANTNFENADLNIAGFSFADLSNANLKNTNLHRADLSKADLTGADISGAHLEEAVLDGAVMTGVKGLEAIAGYDVSKGRCVDCGAAQTATSK